MANNLLLESDVFTGGALAGGWAAINGLSPSQVVGTNPWFAEPVALSTEYGQIWTGITWPVDHSSEVTVHTLTSEVGTVLSLNVRMQSGAYSGYQADISNGTAKLQIYTAGTPTQLGATVSGLTLAANDVWCLQAMGSEIILYQNSKMVAYFGDATYTSGSPGFSQSSTVNITHSQVASWRGYSGQSTDGIWTKGHNGVVSLMSPIAAELGGTNGLGTVGAQGIQNPDFLYEGNLQILGGGGSGYKMWFVTTVAGVANCVGYAESLTGLPGSWTRYSGNPIVSSTNGSVTIWKNAGTYYLFAGNGSAIKLWTSANGVTGWTAQGTILSAGTSGSWNAAVQIFKVIYFDGTTAYAKVDGFTTGNATASIGIFTAVSPFTTWTPYAGNPVVQDFFGSTIPVIIGSASSGNYYFYGCSTPQVALGIDPPDAIRYQTTPPFTTWTGKTISMHHDQQYEGVNDSKGGIYPIWYFTPPTDPTKTYAYRETWVEDSVGGELYQFAFAQSPLPLATIVANQEDGVSQQATDPFTSGTGNLSANWAVITGITRLQIVAGNLVEATSTSANNAQCYTGTTFSNDQYSEITIHTMASSTFPIVYVRMQASGLNGYGAKFAGTGTGLGQGVNILKTVSGANTNIGPSVTVTPNVGDVFRISAVGSSPVVLTLYQNGYQVLQVEDYSNAFTSGNPGFYIFTPTLANCQIANWNGGNANQASITANCTLTGPTSGAVNVASTNFTVTPASQTTDGVYFSDGGAGGTFTPSNLAFFISSAPQTFTYTPTRTGTITLTLTSSAGNTITNSPISYTSTGTGGPWPFFCDTELSGGVFQGSL
jgi:hypothetical protein